MSDPGSSNEIWRDGVWFESPCGAMSDTSNGAASHEERCINCLHERIECGKNELRSVRAGLDDVLDVHTPRTIEMISYDCALGNCDHGDPESCPPREVQVCSHCFGLVEDFEPEVYTGDELEWPCATVLAAGPKAGRTDEAAS